MATIQKHYMLINKRLGIIIPVNRRNCLVRKSILGTIIQEIGRNWLVRKSEIGWREEIARKRRAVCLLKSRIHHSDCEIMVVDGLHMKCSREQREERYIVFTR